MSVTSADQFLDECGWCGPLGLGIEPLDGSPAEFERELYQPFVVVGRRETADVTLDHPDVSRSHAYLQVIAGHVFCVDLQSRTGIHWAGGRQPWGWIEPGAAVQIGNNRIRPWGRVIRVQTGQVGTNRPAVPDSRVFPRPDDAVLELLDPLGRPMAWRVDSAIFLLGRSPACKVHLPSTLCATIHASLVSTRTGIWVVDMRSTTGTLVNGETVRCIKLVDGDDLALGPYRLRIRRGPAVTQLLFHASLSRQTRLSGLGVDRSIAQRQLPRSSASDLESISTEQVDMVDLLQELGRQHRETKEQLRQVVGMFYQMHQEQMALVTGEMRRLGRLVEEIADRQGAPETRASVLDTYPAVTPTLDYSLPHAHALAPPSSPPPRRGGASPRLPHAAPNPAPGAESLRQPQKRSAPESRSPAKNGNRPGAHHTPDSSGGFHLVLARRIVAGRSNGRGRFRRILGWLIPFHRNDAECGN